MKHREWIIAASLALALVSIPAVRASPDQTSILQVGDYAIYLSDDCFPASAWFYPPFYGFPDAESDPDQIHIMAKVCAVKLRWDVSDVTDGMATVQLQMAGWGTESSPGAFLDLWNDTWRPGMRDPVYLGLLEVLHARHTLHVDLATMDVTEGNTYIGRWTFHVTPGEVATGRAEIVRNWFGGTLVSVPLQVTKNVEPGDAANLEITYGLDTIIDIDGGGGTMPEGFGRYVATGWGQRQQTIPVAGRYHDPATSLLLVSYSWHYDDLLFNLYGLIILKVFGEFPGGHPGHFSFMHLIETNIFAFPQPDAGGSGDDGGGDPGGSEGGGSEAGGGAQGGDGPTAPPVEPAGFPWRVVLFFAAVAILTAFVAYLRLPPRGRE